MPATGLILCGVLVAHGAVFQGDGPAPDEQALRLDAFTAQALRARASVDSDVLGWFWRHSLVAVTADGRELTDVQLATLDDPEHYLPYLRDTSKARFIARNSPAAMILTGLVVPPVVGICGLLCGGLVGFNLPCGDVTTSAYFVPSMIAGGVVGVMAGLLCLVPLESAMLLVAIAPSILQPLDHDHVVRDVVTRHNLTLAASLRLDPHTLDPAFFPAGVPGDTEVVAPALE